MSTVKQEMEPLRPGQRLSVQEFLRRWEAMPELKFAELIEGIVYMPSPQTSDHGRTEFRLDGWLALYVAHTPGCDGGAQSTWLMLQSAPQPDSYLWILPVYGGQSRIQGKFHVGAPEWAGEICLSSAAYDLSAKKALYQKAGVQEYVAVLLEEKEIRWHRLEKGAYKLCPPTARGIYRSSVFPGLWLDGPALLRQDLPRMLQTLERGLQSTAHTTFVKQLAARQQ